MTELAKAGNHASCSVDRQQKTPCNGTMKSVALPEGFNLGPAPAPAKAATLPAPPSVPENPAHPQTTAKPADEAPDTAATAVPAQTVVSKSEKPAPAPDGSTQTANVANEKPPSSAGNAVSNAAQSAGKTLDNAGKAVGNAAQKTWTCITSLFGDC